MQTTRSASVAVGLGWSYLLAALFNTKEGIGSPEGLDVMFHFFSRSEDDAKLRRFKNTGEIMGLLTKRYRDDAFEDGEALLIYDTRVQHTWLITSDTSLFCLIDRRKEEGLRVLWRMEIADIVEGQKLKPRVVTDEISPEFGIIKIADKNTRKFSTSLFSAEELESSLHHMLVKPSAERLSA